MKKTYIKPEIEMETIELESMIALSWTDKKPAMTDADAVDVPLMQGKDRDNSDWGGLW